MKFGRITRGFLILLAGLAITHPSGKEARASLVFYGTTSGYAAASSGNMAVNFAGLAADGGFTSEPVPPGLTRSGVNFTIDPSTGNGSLFVIGAGFGPHYGTSPVLSSQGSSSGVNNLVITLPGSFTGFAFQSNTFDNNSGTFAADPITVTLSTGDSFTTTPASDGTYSFLGVTSTRAFTSITISDSFHDGTGVIDLASLTFGNAVVPEPSSLLLAGIGLIGLLGRGLRRGGMRTRS